MSLAQALGNDLGDVQDFGRAAFFFFGRLFGDHAHAERTAGRNRFRACLFEFSVTVRADALFAFFFFLPKLAASGPAAKTIVAVARRLGELRSRGTDKSSG